MYTFSVLLCCMLLHGVHSLNNGAPVTLGTHPAHALVLVEGVPFAGTIINQNHIVTSCRIVLNETNHLRPLNHFVIRAGSIAFIGGTENNVSAVFPHPEFNPWTLNHDVAVLRTVINFAFPNVFGAAIAPAALNERVIPDGTNCVVVGFNAPTAGIPNPPLGQLSQPILNRDLVCNLVTVHGGRVLETMFCAGTVAVTSGICDSTIGGGIYCLGNFTGIATSGTGCGQINSPGIYTHVRNHIQWINAQLTRTQIPAAGPTPAPGVEISAAVISTVAHTLLICLAFFITMQCLFNVIF